MRSLNLLTCVFSLLGATLAFADRPNILFIMSDDHAVRAVSAYSGGIMLTPGIDRLAREGLRFDRAYVGNAICGPSRATMLTGLHSHANGFYSNEWSGSFDGFQQTLPRLLQDAGYNTAVIGKWHLYSDPVGFNHWDVIHNIFEQGSYYNPEFRGPAGVELTEGYVAELITDKALAWLHAAANDPAPFFLIYNHKTPHRDWLPGPHELRSWEESTHIEEPDTLLRDFNGENAMRRDARMSIAEYMTNGDVKKSMPGNLTSEQAVLWESAFAEGNRRYESADLSHDADVRWKYQRYIKTYIASVQSMDREIGRLLDYLDTSGLSDNTLVVYTSDQGFFLGENGWFDKRWMDEVSSRIPLLVRWPQRIPAGSHTDAMVQNIDFAPTLLDAAGVQPHRPMHGVSLLPLFDNPNTNWDRDLYYHFYENPGFHGVPRHYGVHTGRYKLVHYYRYGEWELFDLEADPAEQYNRYGDERYESITRDLKNRLLTLRNKYQVPDRDPETPWYHGPLIRTLEQLMKLL
ncbi:MAG: sulfatase [Halioglobus sp.]|nr:sulfatase [Halioglobus sp.]